MKPMLYPLSYAGPGTTLSPAWSTSTCATGSYGRCC